MRRNTRWMWTSLSLLLVMGWLAPAGIAARDLSLRLETGHAVERGLAWLKEAQAGEGHWSQPEHPALSGLVLTAFLRDPSERYSRKDHEFLRRGEAFLLRCWKPDGGIYVKDLGNYNTSVCMMALLATGDPAHRPNLRRARRYLVGLQGDFGKPGETDDPMDGGVGYGMRYPHSDLSNTVFALEALAATRSLEQDAPPLPGKADLDWAAAIRFLERCQNRPGSNDQPWASDDPANHGGFVYFPGNSKAGEMELPSGRKALRSYGSISYAGLLSFIHADLDRTDPRVTAALDWLRRNFTLAENPGMGAQGLFYYYQLMAKALTAAGVDRLELPDGRRVDWRRELALRLIDLQQPDGSWVNQAGRWWEKDPVLVTAYAVLTLEIVEPGI